MSYNLSATELQKKYEEYMEDFASKEKMSVQQLIVQYAGKGAKKDNMYNTDIILGFLADYYSYYEHIYETLNTDDEELVNKYKDKLDELSKEYEIFEGLIYGTSEKISFEKREGTISKLETKEFLDGIRKTKKDISFDEIKQLSKWLRSSYYDYVEKYRNMELTLGLPNKREVIFQIEDDNLPHLLGIPKIRNKNAFELMEEIVDISSTEMSEEDARNIANELNQHLSFAGLKYKNFLFQQCRLMNPNEPLIIHYDNISSMDKDNDCKLFIITKAKDKVFRYTFLGLNPDENVSNDRWFVQSLLAQKAAEPFLCKTTLTTISTSVFVNPKDNPHQKELVGIFSVKEQTKMIQDLLEQDPKEGRILYDSLLPYFKRVYYNIEEVHSKIGNLRNIQNELNNSRSR